MDKLCKHPTRSHGMCGRPVIGGHNMCRFHVTSAGNPLGVGDFEMLREYIETTKVDEIEFFQVKLGVHLFGEKMVFDRPVIFSKTTFKGCNLNDVVFQKDVFFEACTLTTATFTGVKFHGVCLSTRL